MAKEITEITDLEQRAADLTIEQFREQPDVVALIKLLAEEVQQAETAAIAMIDGRTLALGIGEQLDAIGRMLGEKRGGKLDPEYRAFLGTRIERNLAQGEPERVIRVTTALTAATLVHLMEVAPGRVRIFSDGTALTSAEELVAAIDSVLSAGVGFYLVLIPAAPERVFTFGSNPYEPKGGFASVHVATTAGRLSRVVTA